MSNNTYYVEFAKSGRSKCKKCKIQINKDEIRILCEIPGESFNTTQSFHPICFSLPRKFSMGAGKITASEFITNYLHDKSDGKILPKKLDELIEAFESKGTTPASASKGGDENNHDDSRITQIKEFYQVLASGEEPPPAKKMKTKGNEEHETFLRQVDLYGTYHKKYKNDEMKDILGYNRQVKTGTKDFLLMKLIDGCTFGRLGRCQLCNGGRLKLMEDGMTVICGGTFDETSNVRIDCAFKCASSTAPRYQPWYMEEPSEEEKEEMDRLEAEAKGESTGGAGTSKSSEQDIEQVIQSSKKVIVQWNLNNRDGLRAAANDMVSFLKSKSKDDKTKLVDLPDDKNQALQRVGQIIASNREKDVAEMIRIVINEFGFAQDKAEKDIKKKQSIAMAVGNPANGPLVAAFQELAELYYKTGNANAGATYTKAVKALSDVKYAITAENALGLGKGKTKVNNIGKASAEKIYEFCSTGTMVKLEEKRADAA